MCLRSAGPTPFAPLPCPYRHACARPHAPGFSCAPRVPPASSAHASVRTCPVYPARPRGGAADADLHTRLSRGESVQPASRSPVRKEGANTCDFRALKVLVCPQPRLSGCSFQEMGFETHILSVN